MNTRLATAKRWLDAGLGFLYPEVCQICDVERATVPEGFVCVPCWQRLRFIKPPFCRRCGLPFAGDITTAFECGNCRETDLHFRAARSAVTPNDFMLDIVHRYKYQRALWFEPFLADLLIRQAAPELAREKCNLIVPVPLHPAKQREREFNQAERLATHLGPRRENPGERKSPQTCPTYSIADPAQPSGTGQKRPPRLRPAARSQTARRAGCRCG